MVRAKKRLDAELEAIKKEQQNTENTQCMINNIRNNDIVRQIYLTRVLHDIMCMFSLHGYIAHIPLKK